MVSNKKVTITFGCNGGIGKQSEWWVILRWFAKNLGKVAAFLPILSNHHWSIPGKLSIICDHHYGTGVKLKGGDRDGWVKVGDHIPCSLINQQFLGKRGSQLSSALLLLKNQFVIYSPNLKFLILVFVRRKKWKDSTQVNTNPPWVGSGFSSAT